MPSPADLAPLALVLARPAGLVALALPALVLLLALRRRRPGARVTGTLALWPSAAAVGRAGRRAPPLEAWLAALALLLGALALCGPRAAAGAPRTWTVVVDARPSLELAAREEGGTTRAAAGIARAARLVGARARAADRVRWLLRGGGELVLAPGATPPAGWWRAADPGAAPGWEAFDAPGVTLVTDVAPEPPPARAGLVATGARPAPGPIGATSGATGGALLVWDGERVVPGGAPAPREACVRAGGGNALPAPLERVLEAWCEARGVARAPGPSPRTALSLELVAAGEPRAVRCARDGWSAAGAAAALEGAPDDAPWRPWLDAQTDGGERLRVVERAPGRVRTSLVRLDEPAGDPAAFAVSWAELLDEACAPPAGVVPLDERRRAGEPRERAPLDPPPARGAGAGGATDAWLALGAALACLAALAAGRGRGAGQASPTSTRP